MSGVVEILCGGWTPVLGQIERAKDLIRWPEKGPTSGWTVLLVLAMLTLAVVALSLARRLVRLAKEPSEPLTLFMELAAAHGLSGEEEKMLRHLARSEKLSNPARLFVERGFLERALDSDQDGGWRELEEKLFGG
jgi:hypothetical protein